MSNVREGDTVDRARKEALPKLNGLSNPSSWGHSEQG